MVKSFLKNGEGACEGVPFLCQRPCSRAPSSLITTTISVDENTTIHCRRVAPTFRSRLMPATRSSKRKASPELLARQSRFSTSVTLYEVPDPSTAEPPVRRSKRAKVNQEEIPSIPESNATDPGSAESSTVVVKTEITTPKTRSAKSASPKKAKPIPQALAVPHPAPARWKEAYDTIKSMRERIVAPVDTMGCDQAQYQETDPKVRRLPPPSPLSRYAN